MHVCGLHLMIMLCSAVTPGFGQPHKRLHLIARAPLLLV